MRGHEMKGWTPDERRRRWHASIAAKQAAGLPIEQDERFLIWIEEWIEGEISMSEVQRRYASLLAGRGMVSTTESALIENADRGNVERAGSTETTPDHADGPVKRDASLENNPTQDLEDTLRLFFERHLQPEDPT